MTGSQQPEPPVPSELKQLLALNRQVPLRVVIFSGAGMSAESGIPTFRTGSNGLWNTFNPSDLATPQAWKRDREVVWAWYEWRRGLVMQAKPHEGHIAVADMQRRFGARVITQNVDDLHERAGVQDILHLHGSLFSARCAACGEAHTLGIPPEAPQFTLTPPICTRCGGYVRPGVVWFGENLDTHFVGRARREIAACDLLLIVGTSRVVHPAAGLVQFAPKTALTVEINPEPTKQPDRAHIQWKTTAAFGLPKVAEMLM